MFGLLGGINSFALFGFSEYESWDMNSTEEPLELDLNFKEMVCHDLVNI